MSQVSADVHEVQNPALGAVLLWRFAVGYSEARVDAGGAPLQLSFLVLPILLHPDTFEALSRTQKSSGLRYFTDKFASSKNQSADAIFRIQNRVIQFRSLTLVSFQVSQAAGLVILDVEQASTIPLSRTEPSLSSQKARALLRNSEKLGHWFGEVTLHEISRLLKVRF